MRYPAGCDGSYIASQPRGGREGKHRNFVMTNEEVLRGKERAAGTRGAP